MDVAWDEEKAARNLRLHRLSFATAARDRNCLEFLDDREDYGEERWNVIGLVGDRVVVVTCTLRREERVVRIISARFAERREVDEYYARFTG